jgi:hypothetical protein
MKALRRTANLTTRGSRDIIGHDNDRINDGKKKKKDKKFVSQPSWIVKLGTSLDMRRRAVG